MKRIKCRATLFVQCDNETNDFHQSRLPLNFMLRKGQPENASYKDEEKKNAIILKLHELR